MTDVKKLFEVVFYTDPKTDEYLYNHGKAGEEQLISTLEQTIRCTEEAYDKFVEKVNRDIQEAGI